MTALRILMVGAGAVGGFFGASLAVAGRDVTFLVRDARAQALRRDGLTIHTPDTDFTIEPVVITRDEITEPFDLVVVTVKAFGLESAIDDFAPAVGEHTLVLPLLNGMRQIDLLRERFGPDRVLGGSCVVAAQQQEDGSIRRLFGDASMTYGGLGGTLADDERLAAVDGALSDAGFATRFSPNVQLDMWEKWTLLAAGGAATCMLRGTVGEIVAAPGGDETVRSIIAETTSIGTAAGFPPRDAARARTEGLLTAPGSSFTTSMYRDMMQGFSVEADHILGDLVARAQKLGVAVPLLTAAYTTLAIYAAQRENSAS
jgi:2-dehydropantoate 2-reductase